MRALGADPRLEEAYSEIVTLNARRALGGLKSLIVEVGTYLNLTLAVVHFKPSCTAVPLCQ